jgi:hypothetical protein
MSEPDERDLLAVRILMEHFLGETRVGEEIMRRELNHVGAAKCFELLGLEVFRHIVRTDLATLRARRSGLAAQIAALPKPALH